MRNNNKTIQFFNRHRVFFGIILLLPLYHWLIVNGAHVFTVNDTTYPFFCVDYSMGFCSKMFVGELFHLLVGKYTKAAASAFMSVFYACFILLLAFMAQKFVDRFKEHQKTCIFFLCFFLLGPLTVAVFVKEFGMLDFFWAFFFLLACVLLRNRYLRFLVPLTAAAMVMTHFGSMICYVAALLFILFLYALHADEKKERVGYCIILLLSLAIGVGLTVYFLKNDTNNLVYSVEEFDKILNKERGAYTIYYDYECYDIWPTAYSSRLNYQVENVTDLTALTIREIFRVFWDRIRVTLNYTSKIEWILILLTALPMYVFLADIMRTYAKKKESIVEKTTAYAVIGFGLLVLFLGMIFSTDGPRWGAHAVILEFVLVFYLLYFDGEKGIARIETVLDKSGYFAYLFLFFYANVILEPYTFVF